MSKVTMRTLESVTSNDAAATALINQNFKDLQDAIDNTVSRDGETPNYMDADLDLNNKRILNLADPVDSHDAITKGYFVNTIGDAASYATAAAVSANAAASSAQSAATSAATAIAELQAAEATINAAVANAVNAAAGQATSDIANYVNTTVEPSLQLFVNSASDYANNSSNYAALSLGYSNNSSNYATLSLQYSNMSSNYANNSSSYANNSSNYANSALGHANNASNYADNASIWAEGTDVQVAALGGEHSAKTWSQSNKRNIGEIVESIIPLTDAGLHLLDGALISGSGSYSAFVTYIAGLASDYPDLFETEANWQSAVSTYGVCGKFVYDNVNDTIRLPKITGIIEGTTDATALGDLVAAGLPNITGTLYSAIGYENCDGSFEIKGSGTGTYSMANRDSQQGYYRAFNAAKSSSIYGNSSTVQPQTIKAFYYIVVANSVKTDIEVDIDQIATDLNNKADTTLIDAVSGAFENVVALANASGKAVVDSWGMPDYSAGVSKTVSTTYTAEANGCLHVVAQRNNSNQGTLTVVVGTAVFRIRSNNYSWDTIIIPVPKGWTYAWYNDGNLTVAEVTYFPCIGG